MFSRKKLALVFVIAGCVLGVMAARTQVARWEVERAASAGVNANQRAQARLGEERHHLETRVLAAAQVKPLLAALGNKVDGATLVDLFQSEDWWRDFRTEFPIARVVVGTEVLATFGSPDPGSADRDVVIEARKSPVASAVVSIKNQPYFVVASRMAALADRAPVLVLARSVDKDLAATIGAGPTAPPAKPSDLGSAAAAIGLLLAGAALFLASGPAKVAVGAGAGAAASAAPNAAPATALRESTLKFGETAPKHVVPDIGPATRQPAARAVAAARTDGAVVVRAPAPVAVPSTPAPVGPPRRQTVPGGVPVSEDGSPGQVFGRYHLLDRLGQGGMADVFTAAAHGVEGFTRVFVLKRLRAELAQDKEAVAQFIEEARMQSNLVHSNIVPVFDFGRVGNEYFMTQEYIVGRDLIRLIARYYEHTQQTLTPRLAYYIVHETLAALQYAHGKRDRDGHHLGIVHRDVSAGNIIMSAQGEVKLADFGIVKSNRRASKTQSGTIKGNANFMSPEQARGQSVDARSDLFSVALVLYYCLTNRLLYDGENDLDVLYRAASGPTIEDFDLVRRLPSPAGDVLGRALAPDPADRFQSAQEFADVLAPHIGGAKADASRLMQMLFGAELRKEAA